MRFLPDRAFEVIQESVLLLRYISEPALDYHQILLQLFQLSSYLSFVGHFVPFSGL